MGLKLASAFILAGIGLSYAQSDVLFGRLVDITTNAPVSGAVINWKGAPAAYGTVSDDDGRFAIALRPRFASGGGGSSSIENVSLRQGFVRVVTNSSNVLVSGNLYDLGGRKVMGFSKTLEKAGPHEIAMKNIGIASPSGILHLKIGGQSQSIWMMNGRALAGGWKVASPKDEDESQVKPVLEITKSAMIKMNIRKFTNPDLGDMGEIKMFQAQATPSMAPQLYSYHSFPSFMSGARDLVK